MTANKARRLALAGAVAAPLRAACERSQVRPVKLYDQDTGEVTAHMSLADAQQGILRTLAIEFDVDGGRPTLAICKNCGRAASVARRGKVPTVCRGGCVPVCPGFGETEGTCDAVPGRGTFTSSRVRTRHGRRRDSSPVWRCKACSYRASSVIRDQIVAFALAHPNAGATDIARSLGTNPGSTSVILSNWRRGHFHDLDPSLAPPPMRPRGRRPKASGPRGDT